MCKEITNCVGYIWWSDKAEPEIIQNKPVVLKNEEIPFIIEGQLFDDKSKISYSIKYVDGQYILKDYIVAEKDYESPNVVKEYRSYRMGEKILKFLEYWESQEDELCLGMKVLQPTKVVFVGFKEEEKKL
jgi:CRISPR type III-associated protein (TIGR04423 family)